MVSAAATMRPMTTPKTIPMVAVGFMNAPGFRLLETSMLMGPVVGDGFSVMELRLVVVVVVRVGVMIGVMGTSSGPTLPTERVAVVRLGMGVARWNAVTVVI